MRLRNRARALALTAVAGLAFATTACGASGSSASTPGLNGKDVTIGFDSILSGPSALSGQVELGARAYLNYLNQQGGVNGYTFKFQSKDNGFSSSQAVSVARTLAKSSFAVVTESTAPTEAISSASDSLKVPIFAAANGAIFASPKKYMFGMTPPYTSIVNNDAKYLISGLGLKHVALLFQNDDVGQPATKTLPDYVKSIGGDLVAQVPVPSTATDFSSYAAQLQKSGAQAVLTLALPNLVSGVQKAAYSLGYNPKWTGLFVLQDPAYTQSVPAAIRNNTFSEAFMQPLGTDTESALFNTVVSKAYPKNVNATTQQGWVIGNVIADAVKAATSGGKKLTQAGFMDALNNSFTGQRVSFLPSFKYDATEHFGASSSGLYGLLSTGVGSAANPMTPLPGLGS